MLVATEWGATQKQVYKSNYLGVAFRSDGRQNKELGIPIGKAIAIIKALHYSVVLRRFSNCETKIVKNEGKLSIFETVFVRSYPTYLVGMAISEYRILRTGSNIGTGFIFRIRFDHRSKLRMLNLCKIFLSLRNANPRVCATPSSSLQQGIIGYFVKLLFPCTHY